MDIFAARNELIIYIYICGGQGSHDFIVDLDITHAPMDISNVKPKWACRVMDLRSQAIPSLWCKIDLSLDKGSSMWGARSPRVPERRPWGWLPGAPPPGSVRDVDSSSTSTSLLNLRKNTAPHGRPLTIPARHQGLSSSRRHHRPREKAPCYKA